MFTHVEFVQILHTFSKTFDMIGEFLYVTDIDQIGKTIADTRGTALVVSPLNMGLGNLADYNRTIDYGMTIVTKSGSSLLEVLNAEEDVMFASTALVDYFNFVKGIDFDFDQADFAGNDDANGVTITLSFTAKVLYKRSASYWKGLE